MKGRGHIVGPTTYRLIFLSFYVNRTLLSYSLTSRRRSEYNEFGKHLEKIYTRHAFSSWLICCVISVGTKWSMCKYEMDSVSIVKDTSRTRACPQTSRRTDGQCETSTPQVNFFEA